MICLPLLQRLLTIGLRKIMVLGGPRWTILIHNPVVTKETIMSQYEAMKLADEIRQKFDRLDVWTERIRAGDGYIWAVTSSYLT